MTIITTLNPSAKPFLPSYCNIVVIYPIIFMPVLIMGVQPATTFNPSAKEFLPVGELAKKIIAGVNPKELGITIDQNNKILHKLVKKSNNDINCLYAVYNLFKNTRSAIPSYADKVFTKNIEKIRKKIFSCSLHSCTAQELFIVGCVYEYGVIYKQSYDSAILFYQAASIMAIADESIKHEIKESMYKLGCMCLGLQIYEQKIDDLKQAVVCLKAAERLGHPEAIKKLNIVKDKAYKLGCWFQQGKKGTLLEDNTKNFAHAGAFYTIAKDLGHPDANEKIYELQKLIKIAFSPAVPKRRLSI